MNQSFIASMIKSEEYISTKAISLFEERRQERLEAVSKRLKPHTSAKDKGLSEELQSELDALLQVSNPTAKQKTRIKELQS